MQKYSDSELIEGCRAGKREAQHRLYRTFSPRMYGVSLRYMKNKQDAEDVLQDAFIKVFTNIHKFKEAGSFEGWIRRIVVNTAITKLKNEKKMRFSVEIEKAEREMIEEDKDVFSVEKTVSTTQILELLQTLPKGYQTVFNLFLFERYSHKQIANLLGISENTSKTQLFKAKKQMRKLIENLKKNDE